MSAEALVLPINDPAIVDARDRAAAIYAEAEALTVDSEAAKGQAVTLLSGISRIKADAELRRTALVKPHNDHVKAINGLFRDVLASVDKADGLTRGKMLTFTREQERRAVEAAAAAQRQRLEAEARLKEAERAEAAGHAGVAEQLLEGAVAAEQGAKAAQAQAVLPPKTVATAAGAATVRKVWTFKVVDLEQVPRAYMTLNETAVRQAIREDVREIAGLKIYQDETLSVRR